MQQQLITVADDEIQEGRVVETLELRLKKWLHGQAAVVGLVLRPEQEANIELLDWLESWTAKYGENSKQLIAIAGTPDQFEALELSHPEQGLSYFSSVDEWAAFYPEGSEQIDTPALPPAAPMVQQQAAPPEAAPAAPMPAPVAPLPQQKPVPAVEPPAHEPQQRTADRGAFDTVPEMPALAPLEAPQFFPTVEVGGVVEISGEYECLGCGANRTWLKGDVIEACENVECLKPKTGWKLSCDLF
jgi:hypothetical protein